jgi:hypothetical protein
MPYAIALKTLVSELMKAHASPTEGISVLEVRIKSVKAHSVDVAAAGKKCLSDFERELIKDMAKLCALYACNVQSIGGLCPSMHEGEPSVTDYICWLSTEVTGLPKVFAGINENFASIMIKGTLVMIGGSVDLATLQASAADSGADILPTERDVRRAARVISKNWWRSFGYNYVLATIQARFREVNVRILCVHVHLDGFNYIVSAFRHCRRKLRWVIMFVPTVSSTIAPKWPSTLKSQGFQMRI